MSDKIRLASRPGFGTWHQSRLLNAWVDSLTIPEIIDRLDEGMLFTLNPDHLYHLQRNPAFAAAYSDAVMVSSDSKYVYWALGLIGRKIKCKTSGSDIVPAYYKHHANNPDVRIFFLGARPGVAQQALTRVNGLVGRDIVVGAHGPSFNFVNDEAESAAVIDMINTSGATCLIVGLGAPKQEVWMHRHRHLMPGVKVYMGVGAVIDYEADAVKRAPAWMNRNGLEWVYRMVTEPRRYWRRYARTMEFFWLVLADWLGLYRPPGFPSPMTATPRFGAQTDSAPERA
ncbi:WecB/TagA/CpsF family glycosyltransferase [Sphingobium sp. B12D2B]|uniref:WecB/TagA/CpsF family glycosyltransferase n=1 Tax=Sphingobium sp. B12D2B TaxID=2940577 RepID=UPI002224E220|nr:WecB/TagA/CpsF family glycosyltransferase [Sphingobium sp. B12D2B]MCW2350335.1 exopolysaccharide biosynthesis WecB/TagA/CpsF family protein [Sphingobium sp. B12D2B]